MLFEGVVDLFEKIIQKLLCNRNHIKKERKQIRLLQPFSWKNFGKHTNLQQKQTLV